MDQDWQFKASDNGCKKFWYTHLDFGNFKGLDLWYFAHRNNVRVIAVSEVSIMQLACLSYSTEHNES